MKRSLLSLAVAILLVLWGCDKDSDANTDPVPPDETWPEGDQRVVKTGLTFPWEILWGKDNFLWITERNGKVSRIDPKTGNTVFTFSIPDVFAMGEGGLLGMVQHPDFSRNGLFYVVYNFGQSGLYYQRVVRYTYDAGRNSAGSPQILIDSIPGEVIHNGSRLVINNESGLKLYITTGDAANLQAPQQPTSRAGKVLRLNIDGSVPSDNPVPGNPYWSLGHRNPQGLVMVNNLLYATEHGASIEDELNIIEKNRNFGWPGAEGPCDRSSESTFCNTNNVKTPIWSSGSRTLAVCGIDYYNDDRIPSWKNSILMTTLKESTLYQHQLSGDGRTISSTREFFRGRWGRLRDICVSPAGRVYLCTSNGGGNDRIIEISKPE